ncbi:Chromosomal replication initiator protein DnaA [Pseudobythopirellula maris]|uniref:Chromosomal replication initiator protein DnaA n=1 Tax=Pseudobythopirellula maris TaxID=2527991 RepID=A0A5C5ZNL0_9BACT|nr:DnaA/Hda family protein [Pseudobythopirellula maris]TWT89082.1 Chromosomal replication initiator protein DnaA [Pseudobythopirellula maris]
MSIVSVIDLSGPGQSGLETGAGSNAPGSSVGRVATTPCFVAGPENRLLATVLARLTAAATSDDAAARQTARSLGPVTLVGPTGCGKSHLARGLAEAWRANHPTEGVHCLTANDFRRRIATANEDSSVDELRTTMRGAALLVIEDLDRAPASALLEDELIATFDALAERGAVLIVTSTKPPAALTQFARPLASRLAAGVTAEIAPLGVEAREELAERLAETLGLAFEEGVAAHLAERLPHEPRQLIRVVVGLRNRFGSRGPICAEQVEQCLAESTQRHSPPIKEIAAVVSRYYGQTLRAMKSGSRKKSVVEARAVAITLARELTPLSYDEIGRFFGGRDHSTIMHSHQRIQANAQTDRLMRLALSELRRLIAAT